MDPVRLTLNGAPASARMDFMKPDQRKTLTLGDLIASVYSLYNRRKAKAIVRFAINRHMIVFRGQQRFVVD